MKKGAPIVTECETEKREKINHFKKAFFQKFIKNQSETKFKNQKLKIEDQCFSDEAKFLAI